ncbi:MAG: metallophosphoesterase [Bacteroidetes bacterium]|nr:metallophosphoesterase [Bacteroidota bacterium]HET6243647.1 metallophosphoesterase [Bacteroidia bacterium]
MFLIIILFIILSFDAYFFFGLNSIITNYPQKRKRIIFYCYWGFTLFVAFYMLTALIIPSQHWPIFIRVYVTSVILIVTVSKIFASFIFLVDDIIRIFTWSALFLRGLSQNEKEVEDSKIRVSRLNFLSNLALIVAAVPFFSMFYGMFKGAFEYTIRINRMKLPGLPKEFKGFKIVQISDIHCGSFHSTEPLQRAVNIINQQEADMIFITGDLVNDFAHETDRFTSIFSQLKAPMGVFSVLGNHDYGDYPRWDSQEEKKINFQTLIKKQKSYGWDLLMNENRIVEKNGEKIAIVGVENIARTTRNPRYGDLKKALSGTENIPCKLLLSHDPFHWDDEIVNDYPDVNMTFAGHTHGMQFGVEIPNFKWSPIQYVYDQWAGLYQKGKQFLYVNRGLGFIGYAGRVGILPEITVHELWPE